MNLIDLIERWQLKTKAKKEGVQFVTESWRNTNYIRRRPSHYDNPTPKMLEHRLRFAEFNHEKTYGVKGFENGIPRSAQLVKQEFKAKKIGARPSINRILEERMKARLEALRKEQLLAAVVMLFGNRSVP